MTNTKLLEKVIKEKGLKKGHIAKQLGVSRSGLNNLIKGRADFRASQIQKLSDVLDLTETQKNAIFFAVSGG